jgi:hypothetical protein
MIYYRYQFDNIYSFFIGHKNVQVGSGAVSVINLHPGFRIRQLGLRLCGARSGTERNIYASQHCWFTERGKEYNYGAQASFINLSYKFIIYY